ncbi:MAG: cytochrome c family protein, partial [Ignavibacteriaceae bacterium]|nr:cytochrome c family protein [Ignavibacteriaceae bacterium]
MKKSYLDYILRNRLPVTIFVALMAFALTYFASKAERDGIGYTPDQPINYSHKLHAGTMKIDCQYCHVAVEKSRH